MEALRKDSNLFYSVSCTTRTPRSGEIEGKDYQFVSYSDFLLKLEASAFLEHAQVHGDYYGTLRAPVLSNLKKGVDVLLDIDTQGAATIRDCDNRIIRQALSDIFIMPPNLNELRRRLIKRGTETARQMESRLATAKREMELWRNYRYVVISGSIEADLEEIRHIMAAESHLSRRFTPA